MQITGGRVVYGRTVQPAQYESKKAEVEITFVLAEGEDLGDSLDKAAAYAMSKGQEMVGVKPATKPARSAMAEDGARAEAAEAAVVLDKRTKEGKEAAKAAAAAAMNAKDAGKKPDTEALPEDKPAISTTPENRVDPNDTSFLDEGSEEPAVITDKELHDAAGKKNTVLMKTHGNAAPAMIKALKNEYAPLPKQLKDIAQDKRAEFLKRLEALK
jgi:hypothetical protein